MTESIPLPLRFFQALRHRLDAVRRRRFTLRHGAHEFAMRQLEAKLVSRKVADHDD